MRPSPVTDGRSHDAVATLTAHDHHPAPAGVSFSNTTQSLPPGTAFDLDIPLPRSGYRLARVYLEGPVLSGGVSALFRECAKVHVTTDTADALGDSVRNTGLAYKSYAVSYAKQAGATNLTHKLFDTATGASARYIALKDAVITGSTLRLTFHNYYGGSATLSVKGQAVLS